jgi:hypothetical protein
MGCVSNKLLIVTFAIQCEALLQFGVAVYTEEMEFIDDWGAIALRNLTSFSGFWFDCVTSIPWSFMDLQYYMVQYLKSFFPITGIM